MARPGRGRARGGRLIDMTEIRQHLEGSPGKIMAGRGTSSPSAGEPTLEYSKVITGHSNSVDSVKKLQPIASAKDISTVAPRDPVENSKKTLENALRNYETTSVGCFLHMAINFFSNNNDVEFFMDSVMKSLLKSSFMVEKFAMQLKLLTLLKIHGQDIKLKLFSKLQTTFQDIALIMNDISIMNEEKKREVANGCDLVGQLYYRFRPHLDVPDRYNVLAAPTAQCMSFLLASRGIVQLRIFVKQMVFNYKSLCLQVAERIEKLSVDIRSAMLGGGLTAEEQEWLMCAIDLSAWGESPLPGHLAQFYATRLGKDWTEIQQSASPEKVQLLADIPDDIINSHMDQFDVLPSDYDRYKFIVL